VAINAKKKEPIKIAINTLTTCSAVACPSLMSVVPKLKAGYQNGSEWDVKARRRKHTKAIRGIHDKVNNSQAYTMPRNSF